MSTDPALPVIDQFIAAMKWAFETDTVRFFAGEGAPAAAWDAHYNETNCEQPFLWVRAMQRYRSERFPDPVIASRNCDLPRVLAVELGAARCAVIDQGPSWADYHAEAVTTLGDSHRLEQALCRAGVLLRADSYAVATDTIAPVGPEGGVIGWTAEAYVQFD